MQVAKKKGAIMAPKNVVMKHALFKSAEGEGFEPPDPGRPLVFETNAIDRSAILP